LSTDAKSSQAPASLLTARLSLRKPELSDAEAIFRRYASDPVATEYMSWPTHHTVDDTLAFLAWSDADWQQWAAGTYLVFAREPAGLLLGSTGLSFQNPEVAITGYIFAHDAWGKGFATESLSAMVSLARDLGVRRLESVCHVHHRASAHVMEKCGFQYEGILPAHTVFPNIALGQRFDVLSYSIRFDDQNETSTGSVTRSTD
jgi:ribosomal-protein-alanine N-acetyltransferase